MDKKTALRLEINQIKALRVRTMLLAPVSKIPRGSSKSNKHMSILLFLKGVGYNTQNRYYIYKNGVSIVCSVNQPIHNTDGWLTGWQLE